MIRKDAEENLRRENSNANLERKGLGGSRHHIEDDEVMAEADENASSVATGWDEVMDISDGGGMMGSSTVGKLLEEALDYGQELRGEFAGDPRHEMAKQLDEIFALIAYPNPLKVKEVAHLLDRTGRVVVAEELNSAILRKSMALSSSTTPSTTLIIILNNLASIVSLGKSSRAALETLYAQTSVLLDDLRQDGGDGAFVTVNGIIDDIPHSRLLG